MSERDKYIIDRSKWVLGGDRFRRILGETQLLNDMGNMCCLGQICEQHITRLKLGDAKDMLLDIDCPESVRDENAVPPFLRPGFYDGIMSVSLNLMEINDAEHITLEEIERTLTVEVAELGIELEFVGEYPEEVLARDVMN